MDPDQLGALTVSTLKGEEGFQAKEFRKLLGYLDGLPPFDLVVLPNSLLISMAPALKRALGRPVVCTLQGEDLFLGALREPYRSESMALIARHAASVDGFVATSAYYADFMAGHLGLDRRKVHAVPLGIKLDGHRPVEGERSGPFVFGYFARVAPEKGLHLLAEAYRILRRERGLGESRLAAAGYLAPEHRGYLAGIAARFARVGPRGRVPLPRRPRPRGEDRLPAGARRAVRAEPLRGAQGPLPPGGARQRNPLRRSRATGPSPRCSARTGGGLLFEPNDPQSLADQLLVLASDRAAARALGRQGAEGVRQHHSVARMADRALEVYASVIDGVRS